MPPVFRRRLGELPGTKVVERDGEGLALQCVDVPGTLLRLLGLVQETGVRLTALETDEPNLERVFLHLTGRALRD